jgi:hypothetical protein
MKRKSIAKFAQQFGGNRNISIAMLGFGVLAPVLLIAFAVFSIVSLKTQGATAHHIGVFAYPLGTLAGLISAWFGVKNIKHIAMFVALAVGLAASGGAQPPAQDPVVLNAMQRAAVLAQSVEMEQQIFSAAFNPATQNVVNITPRFVGLIKRFRIIVTCNIQNTDAAVDAFGTPFGVQNILSNVQYTDLQNYLRVNTTGWHLANLASAKNQDAYAGSDQASVYLAPNGATRSVAGNMGNNYPCLVDLPALTHGTNQNIRMSYELPIAYSDDDLRGAIWANVVNATMNLQVTINPAASAFVATGADDTLAILRAGTCSYNGNVTITVYQVYLDQLPLGQNGAVLPILDVSTIYELKNTLFNNLVAGQEFQVSFANFRDFLSVVAVYNNNGGNTGHGNGTDINYWTLQSANLTNIWKLDPLGVAERWRKLMVSDFPPGSYYFSFRKKPISTLQYGNMQLVINPITAAGGNYLLIAFENFGLQNVITGAGSLRTN